MKTKTTEFTVTVRIDHEPGFLFAKCRLIQRLRGITLEMSNDDATGGEDWKVQYKDAKGKMANLWSPRD